MILFVGDIDENLAYRARTYSDSAVLIDHGNYKDILSGQSAVAVAYTSFGDLPKITKDRNVFFEILDRATELYYCPPYEWSDHSSEFDHWSIQRITEYLLWEIHREKNNVHGLDLPHWYDNRYVGLQSHRCGADAQLWVAGCSIPHGIGVAPEQRFGSLLANKLNLPVTHLTQGGSGIPWAADQILRSDIRSSDILIWAITSEYRLCVWDKKLQHMNPYSFEASENRTIGRNLENMVFSAVVSLHQVINFCKIVGVKLILLPTIPSETLRLLFHDCPFWYTPKYRHGFLDFGSDDVHPGPRQHAEWADFCHDILKGMP